MEGKEEERKRVVVEGMEKMKRKDFKYGMEGIEERRGK